ncbi:hypothetical protein ACX5I6_09575 [Arthrobacter sp. MMS24-T111]
MNGPTRAHKTTVGPRTTDAARTQFPVLPQARHWLLLGALLCAAVVALGFTVQACPATPPPNCTWTRTSARTTLPC